MAFSLIFIVIFCIIIILAGIGIFAGVILKGARGKSSCGSCKKCSEEFCSQRQEEFKSK